jgi:ABC-type amino acid transport substrate-binding protein
MLRRCCDLVVAMVAALALSMPLAARTFDEVRARGVISLCANPDALPHASNRADMPGFQIEIARALAAGLGVDLVIEWIVPRMRAGLVNCDLLLDTIAIPGVQEGPIKLSHAYQKSGVALAWRGGVREMRGFRDIAPTQRVGVMVNSLASKILGERGARTVPYAFESDMIDDLAKGDLDACAVSPATIAYYVHRNPTSGVRFVHAYDDEPELRWNLAVGVRRTDDKLVDAVNASLDKLIADGTLARIYEHYGVSYRKP